MPSTVWSGPVPNLNSASLVVSSFTTATVTDISPAEVILWPGMLSEGTRVRLLAQGSYAATTTASTLTWSFVMNSTATANVTTTPATLATSQAITAVAVTGIPWILEYWGRITSLTAKTVGATNAQIVGRGRLQTGSAIATFTTPTTREQTLAASTVAQTATGLVTNIPQTVYVCVSIGTNTGLTSVTTDELTCELLG